LQRSDKPLPEDLHTKFPQTVTGFENSFMEKDYQPDSNDQVIDIVDPSLFCLINGESIDIAGNVIRTTEQFLDKISQVLPYTYQWLPAEFLVNETGEVKIESYINSLPADSGLYPILADIFKRIVPLFNLVISDLLVHRSRVRFSQPEKSTWWKQFTAPEDIFDALSRMDDEDSDEEQAGSAKNRQKIPLPIPDFDSNKFEHDFANAIDLKGHRLQVIVRIESIELTPEKPEFPGRDWHIEVSFNLLGVGLKVSYCSDCRVWRTRR
jgi:hypothetical protein